MTYVKSNVKGSGKAGGQTVIGGTAAGDDLTLQTTSNASKGSYILSELSTGYLKSDVNGVVTSVNETYSASTHQHTLANGATDVTATATEVNVLSGIPGTLTATELGYVDGVTSAIQTQLDAKSATVHTHTLANVTDVTATVTEINYVDGVTSAIQTQLDGKSATGHTHTLANVTDVTATVTELNYVDGVTSAIQTQLDTKAPSSQPTLTTPTMNGMRVAVSDVKTASYTIDADDFVILGDTVAVGAFTITLPDAPTVGQLYHIKRTTAGANNLTVAANTGDTIDGDASVLLTEQYETLTVVATSATTWAIL